MLLYKDMYRKYGINTLAQLVNPRTFPLDSLVLPRESIVHYLPVDTVDIGIEPRHPLLLNYSDDILVTHVEELSSELGRPRELSGEVRRGIKTYHRRYRNLRLIRRMETALRDPNNLIVDNYALLTSSYRYSRNALTSYYQHRNLYDTLWSQIETLTKQSDREHFIPVTIPTTIPAMGEFARAVNKIKDESIPKALLELFVTSADLFMLDLWLFVNDDNEASGVSRLSGDMIEKLRRTNLVFIESGRFCILSFNQIMQWQEEGTSELQAKLRKLFLHMFELRTQNNAVLVEGVEPEEESELIEPVTIIPADERTDAINRQTAELAEVGLLSSAEQRRMITASTKYKSIPNPQGEGTLEDLLKIDKEVIESVGKGNIANINTVPDKSMLGSTLLDFDKKYVKEVMSKDIAGMVMSLQAAGVAVTDYKVERQVDVANKYDAYTIKLVPVRGVPSTIRFRLPVVEANGTFVANGVKCRMNKQRGDLVIRKTAADRVALTTYYGKTFITRSPKAVNNYGGWLVKQITAMGIDNKDDRISTINFTNVHDKTKDVPRLYSTMAMAIRQFTTPTYHFYFDYNGRSKFFGEEQVAIVESKGSVVVGKQGKFLITVDKEDVLYLHKGEEITPLGEMHELLNIEANRIPVDVADIKVYSKQISLGLVLAHEVGLSKLIKMLKADVRQVPRGTRLNLNDDEYAIVFADQTLIVSRRDKVASMLLGGLNVYRNSIRNHNLHTFDSQDVYFNILSDAGLSVRFVQEISLMYLMFIDPISKEILETMKEPTEMVKLTLRCVELLTTDEYPDETDMRHMRIKGYERFSGIIYRQLIDSLRQYRHRPVMSKASVDVNPKAIWLDVISDQSLKIVEDSNPIHNLKEKELVTFTGQGGRSAQTMVKSSRVFHPTDLGVISESTPDSAKVGINTFLTANPKLTSLRGTADTYVKGQDGNASVVSTTTLISPAADRDDTKRTNLTSVQYSAAIACKGYVTTPVRTGYEQVIAHRVDKNFAYAAEQDGKITKIDDDVVEVTYADGSVVALEIGDIYGTVAGETVKHRLVSDVSINAKVKQSDIIVYNSGFFERDFFNPTQVSWKGGVMGKVALLESSDTLEDSCAISSNLSGELSSPSTQIRPILIDFDQGIHNVVKVGDEVTTDSILCTLEDGVSEQTQLFDEETLLSLQALAANNPKAKFKGVVERIEVIYNGDKSDMSASLQKLANASDRRLAARSKRLGQDEATHGRITEATHISGKLIEHEKALIRIYVSTEKGAYGGDKVVFSNALKSVIGRVMSGVNQSESGEDIDAIFAYSSIANRIVLSPEIIGTTNTLLRVISREALKRYREV